MCILHSVWTSKDLGHLIANLQRMKREVRTGHSHLLSPFLFLTFEFKSLLENVIGVIGIHLQYYTDTYTAIDHFCIYVDITLRLMTIERLSSDTPE